MTLTIRPDGAHGAGGYAILRFADGTIPDDEVTVAVMEVANGRWLSPSKQDDSGRVLIGDPNWQTSRHEYGPYVVRRHGGAIEVVVGPEIVNKIEGYTNLRIHAGSLSGTASWPEDIVPLEGAAVSGALRIIRRKVEPVVAATSAAPVATAPVPVAAAELAEPAVADTPAPTLPVSTAQEEADKRQSVWLLGLGAVAVMAAIFGAWWLMQADPAEPGPAAPEPAVAGAASEGPEESPAEPEPAPAAGTVEAAAGGSAGGSDTCSLEALRAVNGGLGEQMRSVDACGNAVSADTLLSVIEDSAMGEDAAALLLFGTLYDASVTDPVAEGAVGLTFGDDPPQAAEYYARAVAAGSAEAGARLARICDLLAAATDTLSQGARDDFCP